MAADDGTSAKPDPNQRVRDRERYLMHLIAVIDAARAAKLDQGLRQSGLTLAKHRTMGWLRMSGGSSMSELARGTFTDRTTLTRVVDQLVADGYVKRDMAPGDRRKVMVALTPAGEAMNQVGDQVIEEINSLIADALEPDVVRVVNRGLLALIDAMVDDEEIRLSVTGRRPAA